MPAISLLSLACLSSDGRWPYLAAPPDHSDLPPEPKAPATAAWAVTLAVKRAYARMLLVGNGPTKPALCTPALRFCRRLPQPNCQRRAVAPEAVPRWLRRGGGQGLVFHRTWHRSTTPSSPLQWPGHTNASVQSRRTGSSRPAAGQPHLHGWFNFARGAPDTAGESLRHSCMDHS